MTQGSQKKKICTPALLFCRSSSRSPSYVESRRSQSRGNSRKYSMCENHPNKNGNYTTEINHQSFFYCERCAILLASQGFNVQKISFEQSRTKRHMIQGREEREEEVEGFLQKIKSFSQNIDQRKSQMKEFLISSQQFYGSQIEEINEYFKLVYQSLQFEKNKWYNLVLNERMQAEESLRIMYEEIQALKQEIDQIKDDIQENVDAVYQIEESSYRPVILQYEDKLGQFQLKFQQMGPIEPLMKKRVINNFADSILSLSQILLKTSSAKISDNDRNVQVEQKSNNSLVFSFEGAEHLRTANSSQTIQNYLQIWADC